MLTNSSMKISPENKGGYDSDEEQGKEQGNRVITISESGSEESSTE